MTANITIQDEETGATVKVTIVQSNVEEILSKTIQPLTTPTTSTNQDIETGAKDTKILDLLMVQHRYNVDGVIATDVGTTAPENSSVVNKKTDLKKLHNKGGVCWMTYEGATFSGNFEKLAITEKPSDSTTPTIYDVKFTFLKGVDM